MTDDDLRSEARRRLEARRTFYAALGSWVLISLFMVVIWLVGGRGYFWPAWVFLATAFAVVATGARAFFPGAGPVTDANVDAEIERMRRRKGGSSPTA